MKGRSPLGRLARLEESRLWRQLEVLGKEARDERVDLLKGCVRKVARQSVILSQRICTTLPSFTLHDERHLLNVLAIMDALMPAELLSQLTPLECALPILAAYVHDLGLALPDPERRRLLDAEEGPERLLYQRHRDGYVHEQRQIERWRRQGGATAERRIALLEGFILGEYVRRSHAETGARRILYWLDAIEQETGGGELFVYGGESFKQKLAWIATSHGQEVSWLRGRLAEAAGGRGGAFYQLVEVGEWVSWCLPALLLRLADIMDFDASRAPRILYQHIGIDNETSILEWEKHLSIVGWDLQGGPKESRLIYRAQCAHPILEKTIRGFASQIETELRAVALEIEEQRRWLPPEQRYELHLPSRVDLEVSSRVDPEGRPLYIYQDLRLELEQSEIQSLLMGEALYGDPALCLRELVQNSLDAVELRDLRLRLQVAQGALPPSRREGVPADPLLAGQELAVYLSWGQETAGGEEWIRVFDRGVGMTRHVLSAYFTRVGRSYYRSPELARERALLARHGLRLSSISCFGIGFLSCFMIADRIVVRTHPGREAGPGEALDITLLGPESLLWLRPGTLEEQGTEVTLYLKPEHGLRRGDAQTPGLEPAELVTRTVRWPLYPVLFETAGLRIEGSRLPIGLEADDELRWRQKANAWGADGWQLDGAGWAIWDWWDDQGEGATGSRVRLVFPSCSRVEPGVAGLADADGCRQDVLAALAEAELGRRLPEPERTLVLVKGIRVEQDGACRARLPLHHGPGSLVWVDLHGDAAPALTADRQSIVEGPAGGGWEEALEATFERFRQAVAEAVVGRPSLARNLLTGFHWTQRPELSSPGAAGGERAFDLLAAAGLPWPGSAQQRLHWSLARWLQSLALQRAWGPARDAELLRALETDRALDPQLGRRWRDLASFSAEARALDPQLAREIHLPLLEMAARRLAPRLAEDLAKVLSSRPRSEAWAEILEPCRVGWWLRHGLGPRLERSIPFLGLSDLLGGLGDGVLNAPSCLSFLPGSDGRTLVPAPGRGLPATLAAEGYDLVFPLGAFLAERSDAVADLGDETVALLELLAALPFLHPEAHDVWARHVVDLIGLFPVSRIHALLPAPELWSKAFADWRPRESAEDCLSALWDLETGTLLWAMGRCDRVEIGRRGRPFPMFAQRLQTPGSSVLV